MKRAHAALAVVVALAPLALLTGCGGTTAPSATSPAPVPTVTVTATVTPSLPAPTPSGATDPKPPTSTKEVEVSRPGGTPAIVTGVRFAKHGGFDRVVIDLRGELPGYTVRWTRGLVQDGSGEPIAVKGGAYLQVSLSMAQAHTESGSPTWVGGPVFPARLGNLRNVVRTGDFEGVVGVGIVLDHRAGFRVLEQRDPNRLVVDVAH